ncbi:MAG TPA: ATP-binding protein [Thermodesulfobacteriota bacterium]|nr:ATP-binding protein [Thermodesulfobacteriota bacterium]
MKFKGYDFVLDIGMEAAMAEILKSRHHLLDLVQVAFIVTDAHSKILYTNRYSERLFGYSREEMEGERIRILFLEEDLTYFLPNIIYLTLYKNGFEGEALLKQKNGTKVFVHLYTTTFKEEGEVFISISFQEIQRLKRLERERLEMERWASLGMMVEEIAHQIRNPITAIGGYTQRLLKEFSSSSKGKSYLHQVLRETKRLETMIRRVEEYVLIPKPAFQKEMIQEVVEGVIQEFSREVAEKGISINLETGALKGDGDFFIDKALLARALFYILENSIDAVARIPMGKRGRVVKVSLLGDKENLGVSISDKGEGIPKKNQDRIFEPFFSTRPDRVGLGLTYAKRVVQEQGGDIQVESRLKRGTTITLTFPKDRRRRLRREQISPGAMGENID